MKYEKCIASVSYFVACFARYSKTSTKYEKREVSSSVFHVTFFAFRALFFHFLHFVPGLAFVVHFFCSINKTQNSYEIREVYSECFVFCGLFCENTGEIRKVYRRHYIGYTHLLYLWAISYPLKNLWSSYPSTSMTRQAGFFRHWYSGSPFISSLSFRNPISEREGERVRVYVCACVC